MLTPSSLLSVVHFVGLALGVGAATVKLVLLLKCRVDPAWLPVYIKVGKLITRQIVLGMILLTLSGVGWLLLGYPFTSLLVVKLILVGTIWALGPVIDHLVEPEFQKLAPAPETPATPAFRRVQKRHLTLEAAATLVFYVVIVLWVLR